MTYRSTLTPLVLSMAAIFVSVIFTSFNAETTENCLTAAEPAPKDLLPSRKDAKKDLGALAALSHRDAFGTRETPVAPAFTTFPSVMEEGYIGTSGEKPVDNPYDNIFHVQIDEPLQGNEQVWLVYLLDGVTHHTGVSKSVNDQLASGGYFVQEHEGWKEQWEQIDASWLKQGDNVIRFTTPEGAEHGYSIRDLKVKIAREEVASSPEIIINQPDHYIYYDGRAYINGFVEGMEDARLFVDGKETLLFKGKFEAIVDIHDMNDKGVWKVNVEARSGDGQSICRQVKFSTSATADHIYSYNTQVAYNEKMFYKQCGDFIVLDGAGLIVDDTSLKENAMISITGLRKVDIPALDAGMTNVTGKSEAYRYLPHGKVFENEVRVRMAYDEDKIPDGYTAKDIRTYFFDEKSHHWVPLKVDTVLEATGEVISFTTHFTDMINGVIQVPESPEANAYNSTSMKGIKAANPTAAVNLIQPPRANNTGNASLSYPLNLPAGRAGMQPQLAISYNSGGGNGWLGLGWNLNIPAVTIDTRWGVPRYDPEKETETYTLNGEQLTPVAHRGDLIDRKPNRHFYPRVEGAFNKIKRHGNNPENYYWEVTDKSGTKYFYGGTKDGFEENAVLNYATNHLKPTDDEFSEGNIAHWALAEVRDLNGNFVRYHYDKVLIDDGSTLTGGRQLYCKSITYTGHGSTEGKYSVVFKREFEGGGQRNDVSIDGRLGFKRVTADRLQEIVVRFDDEVIRSYKLDYEYGEFNKSLLLSIAEHDAIDELFNVHNFEYFDEVKGDADNGGKYLFEPDLDSWSVPGDDILGSFEKIKDNRFTGRASMLGGTHSKSKAFGISAGIGFDVKAYLKSNSITVNVGTSGSESSGMISFLDMNGDGLPDKLFVGEDKTIYYSPNESGPDGEEKFGTAEEVTISGGVDNFYKVESRGLSGGVSAQFGTKQASAHVSASKSRSLSTTSVYISEVNGDGLPDIVADGKVFFNTYDKETGELNFVGSSANTLSPIGEGAALAEDMVPVIEHDKEAVKAENPLQDMVRMWVAPYDGAINIAAPVQMLLPDNRELEPNADGVKVSIQLQDQPLWDQSIGAEDINVYSPELSNIKVKKGNRLFFRLQSVENGSNDSVSWAPVITYLDEELEGTDANNKSQHQFSIAEDYLVTAEQNLGIALDGTIKIEGNFHKPVTSDDVIVLILRERDNQIDTVEYESFAWNEVITHEFSQPVAVDSADNIKFKVLTTTNIDWNAIAWQPHVYYTSTVDDTPVMDGNGQPLLSFYPIPYYSLYAGLFKRPVAWVADSADTVSISPVLVFEREESTELEDKPWEQLDGSVVFSVKKRNELVGKDTLEINDGIASSFGSIEAITAEEDELFFEYHFLDSTLAYQIKSAKVTIQNDSTSDSAGAGVFYQKKDIKFGPLYRGWGHFGYNGNGTRADQTIHRNDLVISEQMKGANEDDYKDIEDPEDLKTDNLYDPKKEKFFILVPFGKEKYWNGTDQFTRLNGRMMQSSRYGVDDVEPPVIDLGSGGAGAIGINKISLSTSTSLSGGIGANFPGGSAGAAVSNTFGPTNVLLDFMDMNGDRYPDVVGFEKIQYTKASGGLSAVSRVHGFESNHETYTDSKGASLSGSAVGSQVKPKAHDIKNVMVEVGSGQNSAGLNGSYADGNNRTQFTYKDINGDGLPDRIYKGNADNKVKVSLNLGYKFDNAIEWNFYNIQTGRNTSLAAGGGVSIAHGSISAGVNFSRSDNYTLHSMQDVNGDGLVDLLKKVETNDGDVVYAHLNWGDRFGPQIALKGINEITQGTGTSFGLNGAFTAGITIFGIKVIVNPSLSGGTSVSRELVGLRDVNGDGFADFVTSDADNKLSVKRSTIGRTNLLKTVKRPLGAAFTLSYERTGNTFEMPNSAWVLNEVKVFDGFKGDGIDSMRTTFAYENGYHNRYEREFFGFEKVTTTTWNKETLDQKFKPYSRVTQTFNNDNYFKKGLLLTEVMTEIVRDGEDNKYVEKENIYELRTYEDKAGNTIRAFPMLKETHQRFYEGEDDAGKTTHMSFVYDTYGRVKEFTDFGDEGDADNISSTIKYYDYTNIHLLNAARSIEVYGTERDFRRREATVDPNTGNVTQIRQYLEDETMAVYDMEYDAYGNLEKITRPANHKSERLYLSYVYDEIVHTYVKEVTNSYKYTSSAEYDFRFGQVLKSIDINGNEISYTLDNLGRVETITGPYEKAGGAPYTIKFEYHPEADIPWAKTYHYDPAHPGNDLVTAIFVDGLGRVLQTKKDAAIFQKDGAPDKEQMIVSGRVFFDALGRTTTAYYPVIDDSGTPGDFIEKPDTGIDPTLTTYDVLNRALTVTLPDKATTTTEYGFGTDRDGKTQFSTKTTDANGIATEQFTDVKGRVTAVKNAGNTWTSFVYNAMSEQVKATDPMGNSTISKYDWFGRRVSRIHPDAGETIYKYDLAGNLTELVTANLSKTGGAIQYVYDHERLKKILYPNNPENDVLYEYGQAGDSHNRAGRIITQVDASGSQDFYYGPLGEVVKNVRTIVIPRFEDQTFVTEWKYDTWNRLTEMTYPDGEKVEYTYNVGGLLHSMRGKKKGTTYEYVTQLGYDKFEQRVFLAYGNGTKTTYEYEPKRRRLKNMVASTASGRAMMDNVYEYDAVNNILSLKNNASVPTANLMGGSSEYSYEYDELYRLTDAVGNFKGANHEHQYTLKMAYNPVGGITQKTQTHQRKGVDSNDWTEQHKTTYDMSYAYGNEQPNAPKHIGDKAYSYDANGNQTGWTHDVSGQRRQVMWDEENRIRAIYDNGAVHHYTYDASGTRVLKGKSNGQAAYVNGEWTGGSGGMGNYTIYVNPYIVLKSGGYTKHFYIEGQRIVSKLGDGLGDASNGTKAGNGTVSYGAKQEEAREAIVKNLKFLGQDGSILTAGNSGKTPPGQINGKGKGGGKESEQFQYFYHPDHLGSTSYITDASGEVYQHLEYFAFGETFVEEHSNTNRTPYLFNGKELDEETGLYYYGARYYEPQISIWLSVDPFSDKYPGLSSFAYVANNPLIFIDPDGRFIKGVVIKVDEHGFKTLDYSKASKSAQRVLKALLKTETGTAAAVAMVESETNIKLRISKGRSPDGGSYAETRGSDKMNDDGTYKNATIIFFEGEFDVDQKTGKGKFGDKDSTEDEFFNVIGTHEGVHLESEQIKKDKAFDGKTDTEEQYKNYMQGVEGDPHKAEVKTRKEYRNKYGGSDAWKEGYRKNYIEVNDR